MERIFLGGRFSQFSNLVKLVWLMIWFSENYDWTVSIKHIHLKSVWKWMSLYKWPFYNLCWPLFCNMYVHLSQNWGSNGHFVVLNRFYLRLVKNLWHKMQMFPFLFFLQFCTKTVNFIFFVFCVSVFFVITFVPIKI